MNIRDQKTMPLDWRRVAAFLASGPAAVEPASDGRSVGLAGPSGSRLAATLATIEAMAAHELVERAGGRLALSALGKRAIADNAKPAPGLAEAPQEWVSGGKPGFNPAESPLALLASRKTRDGAPFLARREFDAGERLRTDYTLGQIMPRLGANWSAAMASGRRSGDAGGVADLTDAALAARQRVDHAIRAVGPELSGVLIDVCCFLKGLERVEMERGWPVRSAKIVLKGALGSLARHYFPEAAASDRRNPVILHWGAGDYRPQIGG